MGQWMGEFMGEPFELLLGRKAYEIFAAHWPHARDEPGAEQLNAANKYVASRTLEAVEWENSQLLEGDVAEAIARLKEQDGPELQVHGSSNLIQTLLRHELIDEFRVWIFPVVLGSGKRLFGGGTVPAGLELVDSRTSTTGVVFLTYTPAGEPRYGSFIRPSKSRPRPSSSGGAASATDPRSGGRSRLLVARGRQYPRSWSIPTATGSASGGAARPMTSSSGVDLQARRGLALGG